MSVFPNAGRWDASNTRVRGERVERYEKGSTDPSLDHIDYGAIALRRSVVAEIPAGVPLGLDAVQTDLARRGVLRAHVAPHRFYEIGSACRFGRARSAPLRWKAPVSIDGPPFAARGR